MNSYLIKILLEKVSLEMSEINSKRTKNYIFMKNYLNLGKKDIKFLSQRR